MTAAAQEARYLKHDGSDIAAYVNEASGTPTWVVDVAELAFTLEPVALETESQVRSASLDFLTRYSDFFGVHPKTLSEPEITSDGNWWFIKYRQEYDGVRVLNTVVGITVDRVGNIIAAGANAYPDVSVAPTPTLSAQEAVSAARSVLEVAGEEEDEATSLAVVPRKTDDGVTHSLVWRVTLQDLDGEIPVSKTVLVDAHDGNVIRTIDNIRRSHPLTRHLAEGFSKAKVTITRDSDSWTSSTYASSSGYYSFMGLQNGSYTVTFSMENHKAYVSSGVGQSSREKSFDVNIVGQSEALDYDWNWGDDGDGGLTSYGLNGVNGVDIAYQYFKNTRGYSGMDAITTDITIQSGDYGATNGTRIWLGGAEAMSTEVTLHEYSHDVIYQLYGQCFISLGCGGDPDFNSAEAAAMDEGYADYFTASMTDHSTFGGPVGGADSFYPSGSNGVTVRWLNNTYTMDDWNDWGTNPHRRGQIIAGASWEVRESIGSTADELVWDALQITPQPESFIGMRRNTIAADDANNSGANRADIEQAFVDKKIGGPLEPTSLSVIGDPSSGDVDLSWNDQSSLEDGYQVQRRLNGGSWGTIASLSANATSHTDQNIYCKPGDQDYDYRVRVYKGGLESFSPIRGYDPCGPVAKAGIDQARALGETPSRITLSPAYPNPFNPSTVITYALTERMDVKLSVFDVLGREVEVLVNEVRGAGKHETVFRADGLPSGLYVIQLAVGDDRVLRTNVLYTK